MVAFKEIIIVLMSSPAQMIMSYIINISGCDQLEGLCESSEQNLFICSF